MISDKQIGEYTKLDSCRFCQCGNLSEILDFGNVPLAGGFLREVDIKDEKYYPLIIDYCNDCYLVQVRNIISVDILFKEKYFFFSSSIGTLVDHFKEFADEIYENLLQDNLQPSILEIGSNDGVLLKPLSTLGAVTIGVDPATNVLENIDSENIMMYNDCFTESLSKTIKNNHGKVDVVLSCYSFGHINDMVDVMKGIKHILSDDGVFIFEIYYLGTLIDEMQYDNFYHEHMSYYSIKTLVLFLKRFNMEIIDVKFFHNVRSGATRFYVKNIGHRINNISSGFKKFLHDEENKGFNDLAVLRAYADKVKKTKDELMSTLIRIKKEDKTIIGYGASGRGTMIMNYCGIDNRYLDYVVDDAPAKHGFYTPGTHLSIKPWDYVYKAEFPDYILLFAWAFTNEVIDKRKDYIQKGGKFIIPLPELRIISNEQF